MSRSAARLRIFLSQLAENSLLRVLALAACALLAVPVTRSLEASGKLPGAAALLSPWVGLQLGSHLLAAWGCGLFSSLRKVTLRRLLVRLALTAAFVPGALLALRLSVAGSAMSPASAARCFAVGFALLAACFIVLQRLERRRRERILLLGLWSETEHFLSALRTLPSASRPAFPSDSPDLVVRNEPSVLQAERLIRETQPDRVYIVRNSIGEDEMFRLLEAASEKVSVYVVPSTWDSVISRLALGPALGDLRTFEIRTPLRDPVVATVKRAFDLVVSSLLLVLLAPLFAVLAVLVRLDSRGPALYVQRRLGKRGREFDILKFRTMKVDAESETGAVLAAENDPRVTRLGRWLRMFRLDELPQLWNVLRGEMSLVGPRPERPELACSHREGVAGYDLRHQVRPGITGLAQIYGRYQSHPREKIRFDLAYVYNYSHSLDLLLLLKTGWVILTRKGS